MKIGELYKDIDDAEIYVIMKTSLGYVAISLTTLHCWGVPRKDIRDCVGGLCSTGLMLDMKNSVWNEHCYDIDEDDE